MPILQNLKIGKNGKKLDNDVTFRFDYSLRDDATANSKLDQNTAFGTAGQKVIRIAPSIDYVVNNRVNLKFYFEQNTCHSQDCFNSTCYYYTGGIAGANFTGAVIVSNE